jgi:2-dehydro-3-deoxygluconokinase
MTLDLITLGESMLRFSPPDKRRMEQTSQFNCYVAGAESNVASGLARLGKQTAWISRLPDIPLGHIIANTLRQYGVDLGGVKWVHGERQGLYFVEDGSPPRPIRVWYDRANSAASRMTPDDLDTALIRSARWLHLTGITPALSDSCQATAQAVLEIAREAGMKISFDVNYRALLWNPAAAAAVLADFCRIADVVFVAARDAETLFGIRGEPAAIAHDLQKVWGGMVVVSQGNEGVYGCDGQGMFTAPAFEVTIVDRVGAGDALAAGVICRLLEAAPLEDALRFGAAMAALKLTIPGDIAVVTRGEVEELIDKGNLSLHR